ncbi:hypothetical protein [Nocardiopsis aegyptia]|uniref:DUF5666 domain-containing protein n=1 Tax=Nocardiopsis aegyptia TaxID=220378 RepID=A0A7Z0J8J2_9ACTN|nr:hypothetical protein [Nocardiopsis aegyptia]NYJ32355.1 hypothetical protein [Nocardiopsis aegyptia]
MGIDRLKYAGRTLSVALLASSVLAVSACQNGSVGGEEGADVEDVQEGENGEDDTGVEAETGSTVTVSAEVEEVLSDESFQLEGSNDWGDDEPLLVVSAPEDADVSEGDAVSVTGTVRDFDYATWSEDYELSDEARYEEFDGRQFIVADEVSQDVSPEESLEGSPEESPESSPEASPTE